MHLRHLHRIRTSTSTRTHRTRRQAARSAPPPRPLCTRAEHRYHPPLCSPPRPPVPSPGRPSPRRPSPRRSRTSRPRALHSTRRRCTSCRPYRHQTTRSRRTRAASRTSPYAVFLRGARARWAALVAAARSQARAQALQARPTARRRGASAHTVSAGRPPRRLHWRPRQPPQAPTGRTTSHCTTHPTRWACARASGARRRRHRRPSLTWRTWTATSRRMTPPLRGSAEGRGRPRAWAWDRTRVFGARPRSAWERRRAWCLRARRACGARRHHLRRHRCFPFIHLLYIVHHRTFQRLPRHSRHTAQNISHNFTRHVLYF